MKSICINVDVRLLVLVREEGAAIAARLLHHSITAYAWMGCRASDSCVIPAELMVQEKGVKLLLPSDIVIADKFDANANSKVVSADDIPDGWMVSFNYLSGGGSRGCVL